MKVIKNALRIAACSVLAGSMALTAVACGGKDTPPVKPGEKDPTATSERRPLVVGTLEPDGVFNPFFSTSTVDANMIGNTQLGMLSTNKNGEIVCGDGEPAVVKDYSVRTVSENGKQYTYYQFIIKNNILFSDGVPLTINDVLFNLYVYLDIAYTGSATMYSTDIVGLNAYRTQNPNANADSAAAFEEARRAEAKTRINDLINYVNYKSVYTDEEERPSKPSDAKITRAEADFATVCAEFKKELNSDYISINSSLTSYKENNKFEESWQVFLVNDGGYDLYKKTPAPGGGYVYDKDENGNYQFDPNGEDTKFYTAKLETYLKTQNLTLADKGSEEYEAAAREWAIKTVYEKYIGQNDEGKDSIKDTFPSDFEGIVSYWGTANTILTQFTAEATSEFLNSQEVKVPNIEGIKALKGSSFKADKENSSSPNAKYNNSYDMLQIKINGVDPKAIYNFAFSVAPLHYYAGTFKGVDYVKSFSIEKNNFGVARGEVKYFNEVLNAKVGVPVGAGPYMATNASGGDNPTDRGSNGFWNAGWIYFKRNPNFYTVGGMEDNAKIKYLRYRVVNADQIITSLTKHEIDFGDPSAKPETADALDAANISHVEVDTNGYGYVGINSRFVPNILVRRILIKAMDAASIPQNYYKGGMASVLYRSMSKANWAYPSNANVYTAQDGTSYAFDSTGNDIRNLLTKLEAQGYRKGADGVYVGPTGDKLDYEFTIAGGSQDHPAYKLFLDAKAKLEGIGGFKINVVTNEQALSKLTNGSLTVWAAAWTSTIDPDMYQVYHKDSKAASVLNWGYDYIKADKTKYATEWKIVQDLSKKIDDGRKTTVQDDRKKIYAEALDLVMELAVEFPLYQRKDMFGFDASVIDVNTMQHNTATETVLTPFNGPLARIWEVDYVQGLKA